MYGPSVTPLARTVLALSGPSSWCPGSASVPALPCFSYQAMISAIHASRSGPRSCWPVSVIRPSIRYFIAYLRLVRAGLQVCPPTDSTNHPRAVSTSPQRNFAGEGGEQRRQSVPRHGRDRQVTVHTPSAGGRDMTADSSQAAGDDADR